MSQRSELARPRPVLSWILLGLGIAFIAWCGFVVSCLFFVGIESGLAANNLRAGAGALQSKQSETATESFRTAHRQLSVASAALSNPAMQPLGWIPQISLAYRSAVPSYAAAIHLVGAGIAGSQMMAIAQGDNGQQPLLTGDQVDLSRLPALEPPLKAATFEVGAATNELRRLPDAPQLADAKSYVLGEMETAHRQMAAATQMWPALPNALGAQRPQQYLVTALNPAELLPTGGPPLAVTVVRVDKGKISIPKSGQTSSDIFEFDPDSVPYLNWEHVPGNPFYDEPDGEAVFVNSNLHPDFRVSGVEMARAWEASGGGEIDGVVAIDTRAIQAVLAATGKVKVPGKPALTAQNIRKRLLVDAYSKKNSGTKAAVEERHQTNNALMAQLVARTQSLQSLPKVAWTLLGLGPARHFQVAISDPALQIPLASIETTGALTDVDNKTDYFAVFTTSSPNKVGIYQERTINRQVQMHANGGASIKQTITLGNTAQRDATATLTGRGYRDQRAVNNVAVYVPAGAQRAQMTVLDEHPTFRTSEPKLVADIGGRKFLQSITAADPGEQSTLTVTYELAAGTFLDPDGVIRYRSVADPQPMWPIPQITTVVTGPDTVAIPATAPRVDSGLMSSWCNGIQPLMIPQGCIFGAGDKRYPQLLSQPADASGSGKLGQLLFPDCLKSREELNGGSVENKFAPRVLQGCN